MESGHTFLRFFLGTLPLRYTEMHCSVVGLTTLHYTILLFYNPPQSLPSYTIRGNIMISVNQLE